EKAHVVGYSMGGMITMKLLATHPDRVRSAVIGGMGWMREGGALSRIWELARGTGGLGAPEECVRSLGALAVTEEEVRAIETPVLVVVGDRDPVKRLYVDPLARVRPDWPIEVIEGAGHMNCVARPEFADRIETFLKSQAGAGGK
ncbi:MAG: alpha/beta fold hydrolase, partial [Planctomycetes bacterium]|nr:alpha/beta fold hydrolase [Planctomycetota bacterium]